MEIMTKQERVAYYTAQGRTGKDIDWNVREHDVIKADGFNIEVRKPSIQNTVYYDDEYENPLKGTEEHRKDVWKRVNMSRMEDFRYDDWKECELQLAQYGCCRGDHLDKPYVLVGKDYAGREEVIVRFMACYQTRLDDQERMCGRMGFEKRELEEDEVWKLAGCLEKLRKAYDKRLDTYWKRYSDKVHASGYWAWR